MITYKQLLEKARIIGHVSLPNQNDNMANNSITRSDLNKLEKELDNLFAAVNLDIGSFGKHFIDRVNDPRNKKDISIPELKNVFVKLLRQHKAKLSILKSGDEKVLNDLFSELNIPFMVRFDKKEQELSIVSKTIMRKANFKTPDEKIKVK